MKIKRLLNKLYSILQITGNGRSKMNFYYVELKIDVRKALVFHNFNGRQFKWRQVTRQLIYDFRSKIMQINQRAYQNSLTINQSFLWH